MISITEQELPELLKSNKPVLLDFWAPWCGPCKALMPMLESLSEELADKAIIAKIDVGENPELARIYGIRYVPTLIVLREDKSQETLAMPVDKIKIKAALGIN